MARRIYARRYAQAVFEIARERNELEGWQSDLEKIAKLAQDTEFVALMENPKIRFEDKARLVKERLGELNPLALNLVYLLVTRGRIGIVADIADEYQRLLDGYHGIERAEVTTAIPLNEEEQKRLGEVLGEILGKKVTVKLNVDQAILGGVVARIGGKLLDGSTRSRLMALREVLAGGGEE